MKITADTNVLVRAVVQDDPDQGERAGRALRDAETVAVTLPALCELVWVLQRVYRFERNDIARSLRALVSSSNVAVDRPAAEAGLAMFEAGGDFADGVIAYQGAWLGGATFVSFDRRAVELLHRQGRPAAVPN